MRKLLVIAVACFMALCSATHAQLRSDYKIAPNDTLVIDVLGEKDLSREFKVTASGKINYYLLGEVEVAGKTTTEVRDFLAEMLDKDYLVNPQVTVDVKDYRIREVFVNGAVNKPGAIPISGEQELTITLALARAGGLTSRANSNKIKFTRPGVFEQTFSLDDLKKENDPNKLIFLKPGDIIEVGEKLL